MFFFYKNVVKSQKIFNHKKNKQIIFKKITILEKPGKHI
jgi:hypothetical protein